MKSIILKYWNKDYWNRNVPSVRLCPSGVREYFGVKGSTIKVTASRVPFKGSKMFQIENRGHWWGYWRGYQGFFQEDLENFSLLYSSFGEWLGESGRWYIKIKNN